MSTATRPRSTAKARPPAKARIHPRFRERWVAVKKEEGRKRLRWVTTGLAVVVAAAGGYAVTRGPLLDVDEVRTVGAERTLLAEVIAAGALEPGRPMLDLNPAEAARSIEQLPWVSEAVVERLWPGSVLVRVAERAPVVGFARRGGGWALADASGRILAVQPGPPAGLPHVHDAKEIPRPGGTLAGREAGAARAAASLPGSLRAVVGGVNLRGSGVELALNSGGVVRLGDPQRELEEKLRAAATVLKKVGAEGIAVLDVTVPRAPVLARS